MIQVLKEGMSKCQNEDSRNIRKQMNELMETLQDMKIEFNRENT